MCSIAKKIIAEGNKTVKGKSTAKKTIAKKSKLPEDEVKKPSTKTSTVPLSADDVLMTMLSDIIEVDLVSTLQVDFSDALLKYINGDTGKVQPLKIPQDMYIVAIVHEINKVAKRKNWMIAKQHNVFYLFNGVHWQRAEDDKMSAFFAEASAKIGYFSPAKAKTSGFARKGVEQLRTDANIMNNVNNDKTVHINLLNGTLEVTESGHKLKAHDPADFLTYVLPFEHDKKAVAPLFKKYLDRVLPDKSSQMVLQEFLGYVFVRHLKLEKALILLGGGQNGKSVMFEIAMELLGRVNVSTKSLGDLTDRDSGNDNRAKLGDKLLNYGSEIRANDIDVDIFKRLVSGEPVAAREKYKTGFDLENNCKFMFNANTLPKGAENTEAYFRRFLIVPFTIKITEAEKDPELHTKIINDELPGVLNWVIEGLDRLLKEKSFTKCTASEEALESYKKESNNILLFVEESGLIPHETSFRTTGEIYAEYKSWCEDIGYRSVSKNIFSKELKALGFEYAKIAKGRGFYMSREMSK